MHLENALQAVGLLRGVGFAITTNGVANSNSALIRWFESRILYNVAEIKISDECRSAEKQSVRFFC